MVDLGYHDTEYKGEKQFNCFRICRVLLQIVVVINDCDFFFFFSVFLSFFFFLRLIIQFTVVAELSRSCL